MLASLVLDPLLVFTLLFFIMYTSYILTIAVTLLFEVYLYFNLHVRLLNLVSIGNKN
jgi:hypothetical protein